ncbi:MAG TPA: histidinol-phosphatase [Nitrospiraceae bacterium]|nr:histidinol-phosphatase [Nitrospiraceae bacterium]
MTDTNRALASLFQSMADQLKARRENPHRIRAYRRAAESILQLHDDIAVVMQRGGLKEVSGIGKDLAAKVEEFLKTGSIQAYEQLKRPLPPDIAAWITLPGLTDVAVQYLYFRLGINTLEDLDALVRSHLLRTLPGVVVMEEELIAAITILKAKIQAEVKDEEVSSPHPQP